MTDPTKLARFLNQEFASLEPQPHEYLSTARMVMARNAPKWEYMVLEGVGMLPQIVLTSYRV